MSHLSLSTGQTAAMSQDMPYAQQVILLRSNRPKKNGPGLLKSCRHMAPSVCIFNATVL